jgi:hypothetical protein
MDIPAMSFGAPRVRRFQEPVPGARIKPIEAAITLRQGHTPVWPTGKFATPGFLPLSRIKRQSGNPAELQDVQLS